MRRLRTALLALLIPLTLVVGILLGGHPDWLPAFARDTLVADSDGRQYEQAIDKIEADYYRKVDRDKLLNKSLESAVESLDDQFSHYFSPTEYHAFQLNTEGAFEGVGMSVTEVPEGLRVSQVYDGSPAKEGGLKEGDVIVEADGKSLRGKNSDESTALIKGPSGSEVTLKLKTGRTVTLKRAKVDIPIVQHRQETQDGKKIGWVSLAGFTSGSGDDVEKAVKDELKKGATGIVFD